ncbi:MAG: hypothetical protein HWE07_07360, partial [Cytophagia bacterium]|nr:hypothetical protein [Cytophagia bacterium]
EKELSKYEDWLHSESRSELIREVERGYYLKKQGIVSSVDVHLLDSKYANGFAISYTELIGKENFQNIFDYLKDKVQENGYKIAQADRRILVKDSHEETIEKWYLKPISEELESKVVNQRFGNVLIEKIDVDRKPSYVKFMANVYQDRQYTEAEPFQDLLDKVFEL